MATFERTAGSMFYGNEGMSQVLENVVVLAEDEYGWDCETQPTNNPNWSERDNDPTQFGLSKSEWTLK